MWQRFIDYDLRIAELSNAQEEANSAANVELKKIPGVWFPLDRGKFHTAPGRASAQCPIFADDARTKERTSQQWRSKPPSRHLRGRYRAKSRCPETY